MTRAEQYRANAEAARQEGFDAQKEADKLNEIEDRTEEQTALMDEQYAVMQRAFGSHREWLDRAASVENTERAERLFEAQREVNPNRERATGAEGPRADRLNEAPTAIQLAERSRHLRLMETGRDHNVELAARRWPVEDLFVLQLRSRVMDADQMTPEQRQAWGEYVALNHEVRLSVNTKTVAGGQDLVPEYLERTIGVEEKIGGPLADDARITSLMRGSRGTTVVPKNTNITTVEPGYVEEAPAADVPPEDTIFGKDELNPRNFAVQMELTDDVLMPDVVDVESFLARELGLNFGRLQNKHFTVGTGVNQPKGVTQVVAGQKIVGNAGTKAKLVASDIDSALALVADNNVLNMRGPAGAICMVNEQYRLKMFSERDAGQLMFPRSADGTMLFTTQGVPIESNNALDAPGATKTVCVVGCMRDYIKSAVGGMMFERDRKLGRFMWLFSWNKYYDGTFRFSGNWGVLSTPA